LDTTIDISTAEFMRILREKQEAVKENGFFEDAYDKARKGAGADLRLAVTLIPSQSYGPKAEAATISLSEGILAKVPSSIGRGDYKDNKEKHGEHKFSAIDPKKGKFNFVQIRLWQDLKCYDLAVLSKNDELFEFRLPKAKMVELVRKYGGLAHGTKKELASKGIEWDSAIFKSETALRGIEGGQLWKDLLPYRVETLSHL